MGSAISFCNNKKRCARTHTLQQRIINSQYETELKHPASQSSRKEEDGLKCFKHHQMCNIWSFWVSNLCGTTLHQPSASTGSRRSTQMAGRAQVRTYGSIRCFLLHSARKTEFAFINILTWIWKLFATRVDQRVQHSWSKECWVRKQTKDRWKRQIMGNNVRIFSKTLCGLWSETLLFGVLFFIHSETAQELSQEPCGSPLTWIFDVVACSAFIYIWTCQESDITQTVQQFSNHTHPG